MPVISYNAHPTLAKFHASNDFVRLLVGPFGSGKSVGSCEEAYKRIMEMPPDSSGVRRSCGLVVRNTYGELRDTTLKTWFEWVPRALGQFKENSMTHHIRFVGPDGIPVECDVMFRALDRPDHLAKLLSLEITWAWLNEAREISKIIFDGIQGRLGRFPKRASMAGRSFWTGMWLDTNPFDTDHYQYRLFIEEDIEGFAYFHQPSGLSQYAENLEYLPEGYYERMCRGKDENWINVYVHGKFGYVQDGKPIHPLFSRAVHYDKSITGPIWRTPIYFGVDFGLTPAAVFGQRSQTGQWHLFDEIVTEDMGADKFGDLLAERLRQHYNKLTTEGWGDPAGDERSSIREWETPFNILQAKGIPITKAPTNDPVMRQEALNHVLSRLDMSGRPAVLFGPGCRTLVKGLEGRYMFRRMKVSGERYADKPDKNIWSHVCEACHYMFLGAGEGDTIIQVPAHTMKKPRVKRAIKGGLGKWNQFN